MKTFYILIFLGVVTPLVLGFFPALHPLFDSYSHFRLHLLMVLIGLLLLFTLFHKRRGYFLVSLLVVSAYLAFMWQPYRLSNPPSMVEKHFKQLQFNLNFRNKRLEDVITFIREKSPDIVTLQEVTFSHEGKLQALRNEYPFQRYCNFYPVVGGVAILSKYPFVDKKGTCVEGKGLLISKVDLDGTVITVASVHLHWPFPYGQYEQFESLESSLQKMKGLGLVSGDFNAAPWSHIVEKIANASNTKVVDGLRWTIALEHQLPFIPNMKLPIDQLLISKGLVVKTIEVQKSVGSDHFPVLAEIEVIP